MIEKEDGPAELVEKINASIEEAKAKGRFHNWS